jgi:DNA-binding transcriptional MerR regulator
MKNRFSIGQMSKLHNIPIKTLRYYDEIDLFKPAEVNDETGYRYYSTEQFKKLDIINYLKALGVPLKDIKAQLNNRDINDFVQTLKKHRTITEERIKELEQIKARIDSRLKEIEGAERIPLIGSPFVNTIEERVTVQLEEKITSFYDLELALRKLKHQFQPLAPIFIGKVGLTLSASKVVAGNCNEYNSIFLLLEDDDEKLLFEDMLTIFPKGDYACIYFRGEHRDSPFFYRVLLNFLEQNDLRINGEFIERAIVDQFISKDEGAFLTEIQVPIKRLTLQLLYPLR